MVPSIVRFEVLGSLSGSSQPYCTFLVSINDKNSLKGNVFEKSGPNTRSEPLSGHSLLTGLRLPDGLDESRVGQVERRGEVGVREARVPPLLPQVRVRLVVLFRREGRNNTG